MISISQKTSFAHRTNESNSIQEIVKWTFCFFRIWSENLGSEFKKLNKTEPGECRNNTIFGYFKYC